MAIDTITREMNAEARIQPARLPRRDFKDPALTWSASHFLTISLGLLYFKR